ncbi:MAG: cytochrome c [SAR202 cluster bacterium]|nr:cytochrome c [SAR202 cluster bacterium]
MNTLKITRALIQKNLVRLVGSALLGATVIVAVACGGDAAPSTAAPTATTLPAAAPTATAVPSPTETVAVAPTDTPEVIPSTPPSLPDSTDQTLLAEGKLIFEKTAGGVGCAFCHGMDGKGDGPAGLGAPANRGSTRARFEWALGGGETGAMVFIQLNRAEKDAVMAYLDFLGEQP